MNEQTKEFEVSPETQQAVEKIILKASERILEHAATTQAFQMMTFNTMMSMTSDNLCVILVAMTRKIQDELGKATSLEDFADKFIKMRDKFREKQ